MTARDLIAGSLRLIGALAAGDTLPAQDAADGLQALNDLLDGWQTERLTLLTQDRVTHTLVSGTASYTIGASGNIDRVRPLWIDRAGILTADGDETPIAILTREERARLRDKARTDELPWAVFYNPAYPLGVLEVYGVPSDGTVKLVLYLPGEGLRTVAGLSTELSLPPGWAKALKYNLALELAPDYGKPPDPAIVTLAQEAKAAIKRTNLTMNVQRVDRALRPTREWDRTRGELI